MAKTGTKEPVPEPVDVPTEKEGADIKCYRAGYEDGFNFAREQFVKGVAIGLIVLFTVRIIGSLTEA